MKYKILLPVFFLIIFHSQVNAQTTESTLQAMIDSVYAAHPASVGIMVHVESPEKNISWSGASGFAAKNSNNILQPDQPVLIASNTKTYVAAAILRLVEMEKLSIDAPINGLLSDKTQQLFTGAGYGLDNINIKHLLSHTSGIRDYANEAYIDFIDNNKNYRWTRDEQLELTIEAGPPLGNPEATFYYSDANYLLLTEIIEQITGKPFYGAMRDLLDYKNLGLNNTWFYSLETKPKNSGKMATQYWSEMGWNTNEVDVSVDLFGGGGIASTTHDLSIFFYKLFNHEIIHDTAVFNLIYTKVPNHDAEPSNYFMGIAANNYMGFEAFEHSGFWGTIAMYFPELKTSVSVFVLERDQRWLRPEIADQVLRIITN
jgi:D-alanyl-D-alanine carboxypeptidase